MPDMSDPRFAKTVIYMCAHSDEGGMGLIVNKPEKDIRFSNLLEQWHSCVPRRARYAGAFWRAGGSCSAGLCCIPVTMRRTMARCTWMITIRMTATLEVLEDIAKGEGPDVAMLALGYAGWGPGQLEIRD